MYNLSPLPYAYDALEPYIDAETMRFHHDKHHQAYVDKLNQALDKYPELQKLAPEDLLKSYKDLVADKLPIEIQTAIKNHGGGVVNHDIFWEILSPEGPREPLGELREAIRVMGGFDKFKTSFTDLAMKQFGSGWAWLVIDANQDLQMYSSNNQDSPLIQGHFPLLAVDVWEHAYYLKYQNKRNDYLEAIWHVLDWQKIEERYQRALNKS